MFKNVSGIKRVGALVAAALCMVTADKALARDPQPARVSIYSQDLRHDIADAGYASLELLPTREEIAQVNDKSARLVLSRILDLTEKATQADSCSDAELEQLVNDVDFVAAAFQVRVGDTGGSGTTNATDPFDCVGKRDGCLNHAGCTGGWPCFCCVPCNLAFSACIAISVIDAV